MLELVRNSGLALMSYGAETEDIIYLYFLFIGLIPIALYGLKVNNSQNTTFKNIGIQIARLTLFFLSFYTYCRY